MKQISGLFQRVSRDARSAQRVKVGVTGMADIGGWIRAGLGAAPFQIEVKTGHGSQSGPQKSFEIMCVRTGAAYLLASFVTDDDLKPKSAVIRSVIAHIERLRE